MDSSETTFVQNVDDMPVEARQIPMKLLTSIEISLEEQLYLHAIDSLSAIAFQGLNNPKLKEAGTSSTDISKPSKSGKSSGKHDDAAAATAAAALAQPKRLIYIPPPEFLAIITTLSLHPEMTSKKRSRKEFPDVGERARKYLANLIHLAGPGAVNLREAWKFRPISSPTRAAARKAGNKPQRKTRNRSPSPDDDEEASRKGAVRKEEDKHSPFAFLDVAHEESLFAECEDGWAVVGWAFVCSVEFPRRWAHYSRFLKLLLETLNADWNHRLKLAEHGGRRADLKPHESLASAMGLLPKESQTHGSAFYKRMSRAIFADGSDRCLNEWTPIFKYEVTKRPRRGAAFEMFKNMDTDSVTGLRKTGGPGTNGWNDEASSSQQSQGEGIREIGEDEEKSDSDADEIPRSRRKEAALRSGMMGSRSETPEHFEDTIKVAGTEYVQDYDLTLDWGGMESIVLRQGFMSLICNMHQYDKSTLRMVYDEFSYTIRTLGIDEMLLFITTVPECSDMITYRFRSSLWQAILGPLMGRQWMPDSGEVGDLSDDKLTDVYLPATANKSELEANAKVAVVVEALARLWFTFTGGKESLVYSERLEDAIGRGILAREKKCEEKKSAAKKNKQNVEEARRIMNLSHERLRVLLRITKKISKSQ